MGIARTQDPLAGEARGPRKSLDRLPRAAVAGIGFIGLVHIAALRRLGVDVVGACGETTDSASIPRGYVMPPLYKNYEELLADPTVDIVHVATPNHLHYAFAKAALLAGKHVVCEKPLALTSKETSELVALAAETGLVACVNFNLRYYPQVHEARARIAAGAIGEVWNIHGAYLQDWLLYPTDWNWRLDPKIGGQLRAVADIGSHWLDLAQFISGHTITAVCADLATTIPARERPVHESHTFEHGGDGPREAVAIETEDVANLMLRFANGARGSCVLSQVSAGRRNNVSLEIDGSAGALSWHSERNEELWLGHRSRPNELLWRDPALMSGPLRGALPAGHAEGFEATFRNLYASIYDAVATGGATAGLPTLADGHRQTLIGEMILESHRSRQWVEVPA
jgi:predicted dehydrogenase